MKKLITLLLLLASPAYADQALPITKGQPSPVTGTVLDTEKAKKVEDQLIDADTCQKENTSYQQSIDLYKKNEVIYNQENSMLLGRNVDLSKALSEAKETSDLTKILYFVGGIAVVGIAAYAGNKFSKR
jgi:hypothetical protein